MSDPVRPAALLPGEVPRRRLAHLGRCREMDEAVLEVHGGPFERAAGLGLAPDEAAWARVADSGWTVAPVA